MLVAAPAAHAGDNSKKQAAAETPTVKAERNHLRAGNSHYNKQEYQEAEVEYRKALEANPSSAMAQFNLATALLRQQNTGAQRGDSARAQQQSEAVNLLMRLAKTSRDSYIASRSAYDLGNVAYRQQAYDQAVELYKQSLRVDPAYDDARYNLRMAQLKQQQSKQNKGGGNGNKDNKDKDKKNKKDKDKDKQGNNDKQKNNQDKNKQNEQNQNQNQKQQPQNQQGLSNENMDRILQSVQNQENATQQRAKQVRAQQQQAERQRTRYKW